jgi:hypothetical protein
MTEPPDVEHSAVAQAGPTLVQIAGRVLNRPLLLHPDKADLILHVLQGRIGIEPLAAPDPQSNRFVGSHRRDNGSVSSLRIANGVAILPIVGSLVNRGAWIGANSGLVSYESIAAQLREAEADLEVQAILLFWPSSMMWPPRPPMASPVLRAKSSCRPPRWSAPSVWC